MDELQDCNSKFSRRLVEVLWFAIHTTRKFLTLNLQKGQAMLSSLFSRNVEWRLQVKHLLAREISLLIWIIQLVLFNFRFEINMAEKCPSKFHDIVLDINNNCFLQSYIEQTCFLTCLVCFFLFCFFFGIFQPSRNKRSASAIKETPDRVGTTFFRVKYGLDDFLDYFLDHLSNHF